MGRVTGQGIAGNIRAHYSPWLLRAIVGLLLAANIINLGADLGAMAAALKLLVGGPTGHYVVGFAIGCVWLEAFSRYERYVSFLKWTSFVLLAYVAVALVFAAGIIGIGLLAVPVLAGSGAYALGEALGWTTGLDRKPLDAKALYGTIAVSTLIGISINFVGLDPIKALFWSAVINGVVAVPVKVIIMLMAMRRDVVWRFVLPRPLWAMGWLCTGTMAVGWGSCLQLGEGPGRACWAVLE